MAQSLIQAYRQAPWRKQLQGLFLFLLVLVGIAMIAWVYLSISAQAATAGLEIQFLEEDRDDLARQIADLQSQLGYLTSAGEMERRAKELGFEPADPTNLDYVVIPGYTGRQTPYLAPAPVTETTTNASLIKPAYTQSLWEFLFQGSLAWSEAIGGTLP